MDMAEILTAVAGVITALAVLLTAVGVVLPQLLKLRREVREVHTIVNAERTAMLQYRQALTDALTAAGVVVPVDQSARTVVDPPATRQPNG